MFVFKFCSVTIPVRPSKFEKRPETPV